MLKQIHLNEKLLNETKIISQKIKLLLSICNAGLGRNGLKRLMCSKLA